MNKSNTADEIIMLAHGGGGVLTGQLIKKIILSRLHNPILEQMDDGACISVSGKELVFTTDSYVVTPPFFPGGDIGTLAVCGTVNDLVMQGAEPGYLSFGLILEQGFSVKDLERIVDSMAASAERSGTMIVTGDTKVIERMDGGNRSGGSGDRNIFINTAGIGYRIPGVDVHVSNAKAGDVVIVTGPVGCHGTAVMCGREKSFRVESGVVSDVAPLWELMAPVFQAVPDIHCLRDPTRGGVAAALCDIAERSGVAVRIREADLPVEQEVLGVCDMLGLDPLNAANEGIALIFCAESHAQEILSILRSHPLGRKAVAIGIVAADPVGMVIMETKLGGERIVRQPMGEDFPRIC